MTSTSSVHLTCLCGAVSAPGTHLSDAELPIPTEICHCNTCRHTTGSLGLCFAPLKDSPSPEILSKVTGFHSSHILTRYFCSTCGCQCFVLNHRQKKWYCLGGIIEWRSDNQTPRPNDIVHITRHDHVLDTIDGGLAPLLLHLHNPSIPTWSTTPLESPPAPPPPSLPQTSIHSTPQPTQDSYLPVTCHCGGVSLLLKRANWTPDSAARYIPSDATKYLAYLCACRSCRLATGASLVPWALVPPGHVFNAKASATGGADSPSGGGAGPRPVVFGYAASSPAPDANAGLALRQYWSSADTCRSFCGGCGATVAYWCARRPDEVDLAVGVLRGGEGSMARRWLQWEWGRCSFAEECVDRELCEAWKGCADRMRGETGG